MRFILVLFVSICFSQNKQSFYFDFNESTFNSIQQNYFQDWLKNNKIITIVKVEGYCDSIGTNTYNVQLANKRIDFILNKFGFNIRFIISLFEICLCQIRQYGKISRN